MSLTADHVHAALAHAVAEHGAVRKGQSWLLPAAVLMVDHLTPLVLDGTAGVAYLNVGREKQADVSRLRLRHVRASYAEVFVDLRVSVGNGHPYRTLLTCESEASRAPGRSLGAGGEPTFNGYMWDLFKLLLLPSPVRLFVTWCADSHREALVKEMGKMVTQYSGSRHVDPADDLWSISFPTVSLNDAKIALHRWAPNAHGAGPVDHSKLFPA